MKKTKLITAISTLVAIFITAPIWYYLMYRILQGVHASNVMWLLYWIYWPLTFFLSLVGQVVKMLVTDEL